MVTEEQIKELAYTMWEQEGRQEGKDLELYYRAKKILEDKEASPMVELAAPPTPAQLASRRANRSFGDKGKGSGINWAK